MLLDRLTQQGTLERTALDDLVPDVGTSKAALLHALLSVGIEAVREHARESGYEALAAQQTAEGEREVRTTRRRQLDAWRDET
ncbi:MAG: hypothetical protein GEU83_07195 [Pseudonocardiaceae bacterium]|nr:hypothetical protein [Pseudonocardiaceae bacterium]